jgi:hypothetical protein
MTGPAQPATDKAVLESLRGEVFLDDVGANLAQQEKDAAAAAEKKKKEDDAKEAARIQAEAVAALPADPRVSALQEALRISEEARKRAEVLRAPAVEEKEEKEEPELTTEQLNELYKDNPMAAIEKMLVKRDKMMERNFSSRLSALTAGTAGTAREMAEKKYADEFRLFGKEIDAFVATLPQAEQRLSNSKAWDDLIAFMRGQPGNFEKLMKDREEKNKAAAAAAAQANERAAAGAHTASTIRAPSSSGDASTLDETEREIARTLNPNMKPEDAYADYIKWRKVGS